MLTAISVSENVGLVLEIFLVRSKFFPLVLVSRVSLRGGFRIRRLGNLVPLQSRSLRSRSGERGRGRGFPIGRRVRTEKDGIGKSVFPGEIDLIRYRGWTTENNVSASKVKPTTLNSTFATYIFLLRKVDLIFPILRAALQGLGSSETLT